MGFWSGRLALAFGALAVLGTAGCMQERPAINRVQPNYLDKNDFIPVEYTALTTTGQRPEQVSARLLAREPVFYTQTTLIAKPTHGGFTGLTQYTQADKVRWEVTENFLIARQAWEYIHGAPIGQQGIGNNPQHTGDVIAAYRIESHFDIRRDYNSTTGEELNVITENTSDRPWYQRRFMRVDWSENLIDGYNTPFEAEEWQGRIQSEPVPMYINNPQDPNAPTFAYSTHGENRQLDYFDIVNRAIMHPETTSVSFGDGSSYPHIPACFFDEPADCAPAEVTLRVAFRRLDPHRDYEPAMVSNPVNQSDPNQPVHLDMERFGFFDQNRVGYDAGRHAILDTERVHWASRHNLWQWHHALFTTADAPASGAECNSDRDCQGENMTCRIGNTAAGAHRGVCQAMVIHHLPETPVVAGGISGTDMSCQSDADCIQAYDNTGVSHSAICDGATHTCGEHFVRCYLDSECSTQIDPNSTCDRAIAYNRVDNRGLCTMPFRQRQVRQVAYHETENYPAYMEGVTRRIVHEWNSAFANAVQQSRVRECQIEAGHGNGAPVDAANDPCNTPEVTGTAANLGDDWLGGGDASFPFVGCHSPVWGTAAGPGQHSQADVDEAHAAGWDLGVCGEQGTVARIGDLRYSQIGGITDHDAQGYWGLANIASDPETGEMVIGRGAVWQTITDYYATTLVDMVKILNGELQDTEFAEGFNFVESAHQLGSGQTAAAQVLDAPLQQPGGLAAIANANTGLNQLLRPDAGWFTANSGHTMMGTVDSTGHRQGAALDVVRSRVRDAGFLGDGTNRGAQRLLSLAGTGLEGRMMNDQQMRLAATASAPTSGALTEEVLQHASPVRGQSSPVRRLRAQIASQLSAWQCNYDASFSDDMLFGLAQRLHDGAPITCATDPEVCFGRDWDFHLPSGDLDYDLMAQYAANFIHHGVLAHEIGHSLGQRHNFTGSADAINYFDQYWRVRGLGHGAMGIRPRYEYVAAGQGFYSDEERAGRVDEYSYSSVMDYKGLNEDAHGLGRYDYAFIANGYTNLVQAFRNVADMGRAQQYYTATAGNGFSTPIDLTSWQSGVLHGLHYTMIPEIFGTNAAGQPNIGDDNRYWVFLNETTSTGVTGWGDPSFTNMTADGGHLLVPYRFDSDNRAGLVWQDQRYDAGADGYESLHYVQERFLNYYFQNSYGRYRSGFSTGKYVARMWSRYMEQIHQTTQIMAFDMINFGDFFSTFPSWDRVRNDPTERGGYVNLVSTAMTADTLTATLTMPEMGIHNAAIQADGSNLIAQNQINNAGFNIPINVGRAFESNWRQEAGFWWYEQLNRAGSYYDKVMAVEAMVDPELALLGRDTPNDIRQFQLSMYTIYPAQMIRLFGGLLAEDNLDFAPIVNTMNLPGGSSMRPETQRGWVTRTHVATLNLPAPANGRVIDNLRQPIDPQDHFTIQLVAAVHTIAEFPASYDQRYMDYARLWVDGSTEAVTVSNPAVNTVSFEDPWNHMTYRALHFGAAAGEPGADVGASPYIHPATGARANEAGVAARMILHIQDLDFQRLNASTPAARTAAEQAEHKYLDLLSVMRDLTRHYGSGVAYLPENG